MSKPLTESLDELKNTVEHHLKNVHNLMRIIQKQRADLELAYGLMNPEQQEVFTTTVRIADEQANEIKDMYEAKDVDEEE
tara:strand:- start:483 stop:722 length:240 start_codon:yes stop_codon:yes gene_type:complete